MTAKIVAEEGTTKGLVLSLEDKDEWIIGRDAEECDLVVEDLAASRRHVLCKQTTAGITIENLSDSNPIFINNLEIDSPHLLKNGDNIRFGNSTYRFYAESEAHLYEESFEPSPDESFAPPQQGQQTESSHPALRELTDDEDSDDDLAGNNSIFDEDNLDKNTFPEISFDLTESGRWLLKVIGGPNNGAEFNMQSSSVYTIGTDPNTCDIVFQDTSVSRQHIRVSISEDDVLTIEDLKSRNGTLLDGEPLTGPQTLDPNIIVTIGTTSFVIYDREGEMQTIISPLLPSIVKVLQKEEPAVQQFVGAVVEDPQVAPLPFDKEPSSQAPSNLGKTLLLLAILGLLGIIGFGTSTLFRDNPIAIQEEVDTDQALKKALAPFPDIRYSFNKGSGRLLLVGHVLTGAERNQLLYSLQSFNFIKNVDDSGVIIDEGVWREINQILAKNPNWRGVSVSASAPGKFVLNGNLKTKQEADQIWDYINSNFPYLDLLERRIIVEEELINTLNSVAASRGYRDVVAQMSNGEVTITGIIPIGKMGDFDALVEELKDQTGVRFIRSFVREAEPEASIINLTDRYDVTGVTNVGGVNTNVVINGRILKVGDILDGMVIREITPSAIFLERDDKRYKINYSR